MRAFSLYAFLASFSCLSAQANEGEDTPAVSHVNEVSAAVRKEAIANFLQRGTAKCPVPFIASALHDQKDTTWLQVPYWETAYFTKSDCEASHCPLSMMASPNAAAPACANGQCSTALIPNLLEGKVVKNEPAGPPPRIHQPWEHFGHGAIANYFSSPMGDRCRSQLVKSYKEAGALERFFQSHPTAQVPGVGPNFLTNCLKNPQVLKTLGLRSPPPPKIQATVIADWYLAMNRLRDTWIENYDVLTKANEILGKPKLEGVPCRSPTAKGLCRIQKPTCGSNGKEKGYQAVAADAYNKLKHLPSEVVKLQKRMKEESDIDLDYQKAEQAVLLSIPYLQNPHVNTMATNFLNHVNHTQAQFTEAYRRIFAEEKDHAHKALESAEKVMGCIESNDPQCMADDFWKKIQKTFSFNFDPDGNTQMAKLPPFDFEGFIHKTNKDVIPKISSPKEKALARTAMHLLNEAECTQTYRAAFAQARYSQDDLAVNFALIGLSGGLNAIGTGIKFVPRTAVGLAKIVPTKSMEILPAMDEFGQFYKTFIDFPRHIVPGKTSLGWVDKFMKGWVDMSRNTGMTARLRWANRKLPQFLKNPTGPSAAAFRVGARSVDAVWLAYGVPMAAEMCHPILESLAKGAGYAAARASGCDPDPLVSSPQGGEYIQCFVGALFGLAPLAFHTHDVKTLVGKYEQIMEKRRHLKKVAPRALPGSRK